MITAEIFLGALLSLLVIGAGAFYWILSEIRNLRKELLEEIRTEIRGEGQERRADTQRILEAIYFHRHDPDGVAVFYPPTSAD